MGLRHEDLWRITYGQLLDLIDAWRYKEYLIDRHNAAHAFYVGAVFGGKIKSVEDLCGVWENGQVMSKAEAFAFREKMRKKAAKKNGKTA